MAILQTDVNGLAVTDNSGKELVRTSGSVLQVVQGTSDGTNLTTNTSFVNSSLSASITPRSTTNRILIIISSFVIVEQIKTPTEPGEGCYLEVRRLISGGSIISLATASTGSSSAGFTLFSSTTDVSPLPNQTLERIESSSLSISYLDSPNTTSTVTYTLQYRSKHGGRVAVVNGTGNEKKLSSIVLLEIVN